MVQAILRAKIPAARIWVFGSRAKGMSRHGSDLDLAIDNGVPLSGAVTAHLADAFEEAPLAFGVDLIDLHNVSGEFRALIEADKIPFPGFE